MIELIGNVDVADWWETKKYQIDEEKIFGFEVFHNSSWHIKVRSKEKQRCKKSKLYPEGYYYDDYYIGNCVGADQVVALFNNPKANILELTVTYPNSTISLHELNWLLKRVGQHNSPVTAEVAKDGDNK